MNFSAILDALNHASAFELYRLNLAIHRKLDDPAWNLAVQQRVLVGAEIEYFSLRHNAPRRGRVLEKRRKQVLLLDLLDNQQWLLDYCAINLDGVDVRVREQTERGLGRNEVAVGQIVGFLDREGLERSGVIERLNDKTVSIKVGTSRWRVAYQYLHRVVDAIPGTVVDQPGQATLLPGKH